MTVLTPGLARALAALLVVASMAIGVDNLTRPLANPDEGRYSEIAREMAGSGDWVTPRLNGFKYLEKPPLQYWASAASMRLLGETELAARLYTGGSALAIVLLVAWTARRLWGAETALASTAALLASPYFVAMGCVVTLDMGLTLWTTLTACAFLVAQAPGTARDERRRWMLLAWAAMAMAVLSKGLVGVVFPAAALVLGVLATRDLSVLSRMHWGYGILLAGAIAAPWFVAVSLANPEFPEFFFIHEHFTRFTSTAHRRTEPWWYFLPIVVLGFLPWMLALPAAVLRAWRAEDAPGTAGAPLRYALAWSAFVVVFFSASGSKLPAYVLPAFPLLAFVLGRHLAEAPPRRLALALAPMPGVALLLAAAAWRAPASAREPWTRELYALAQPGLYGAAAALFAATLLGALLMRSGRRWAALVVVALGTALAVDSGEHAFEQLSPRQSGLAVATKLRPWLRPDTRVYSVNFYDQSLTFYIGRTVTLVEYEDEFALGQRAEPGRAIPRMADFPAEWRRPGEALAIMQPGHYERFRAEGLPMQLLHEDPRRVLVRKP